MEIPIYIYTYATKYIGKVDADTYEEALEKAEKVWEEQEYDYPTLCHHCSEDMDLGDFIIFEEDIKVSINYERAQYEKTKHGQT